MSGHRRDVDDYGRKYQSPYTPRHPIPTIQKYREEKEARKAEAAHESEPTVEDGNGLSKTEQYKDSWRAWWRGDGEEQSTQENRHDSQQRPDKSHEQSDNSDDDQDEDDADSQDQSATPVDTSQIDHDADPKKRRKGMGKRRDDRAEREVTDPITHLPVKIYDRTADSLKDIEENPPGYGKLMKTATGLSNRTKSESELEEELHEMQKGREAMENLFPPPKFDQIRDDIIRTNSMGFTVGLVGTLIIVAVISGLASLMKIDAFLEARGIHRLGMIADFATWLPAIGLAIFGSWFWVSTTRAWTGNQIAALWDEQIWDANRQSSRRTAKAHENETVAWLNALMSSIWPLINPDLMTSLADTLEDVMQASLPKIINMVSIDDIGQGSESLRILGVRWLPTGAAARSVNADGELEPPDRSERKQKKTKGNADRGDKDPKAKIHQSDGHDSQDDQDDSEDKSEYNDDGTEVQTRSGLAGEEGDFINLEIALAYKVRAPRSMRERNKDIHLYLAFYLAGNIKIPIWVDVRGFVGTLRLRLQLIPDPPFFGTCLISFLGQPRVELSCIPLLKRGLNVMDLPLIKNFVQSSVDAAMSQYVAPKSLMLNLQDMLSGDDFKKDTVAEGVLVVHIKRGYDFKMGDVAIPLITSGGSDPYVSVGWAKFGKALWSTRVLIKEMEPVWRETAYILVTGEEVNVSERLRVQLWDSDRFTADDDLGRIEVDLKEIMNDPESNGKLKNRTDGFRNLKAGEEMPGKLEWQLGYFKKVELQECQFQSQSFDPEVRNMTDLKKKVDRICEDKLREVRIKKGRHLQEAQEMKQQKAREMKMRQDAMIMSAPPPEHYHSGVFSIQIHQITGLGFHSLHKSEAGNNGGDEDEEKEEGDELPSAYCNVIFNHKKIYKTRVKPSNPKPFYNASTERFISDWRSAEVFVSVRDSRVDEVDPIIGIVHLPLGEIFEERTQVSGWYPLVGGVGFGRVRLSLVWRSVKLQAPKALIGWDHGTLEVHPTAHSTDLSNDLRELTIKCRTNISTGKLTANSKEQSWTTQKNRSLRLAVHRRYSSNLVLEFKRYDRILKNKVPAFAVLWLKDIPDEEPTELNLTVWKGDLARARATCLDDCGEVVGHIQLKVTFWSGLGGAHRKWASHNQDTRDVMEVLDIARDHYELKETEERAGISTGEQQGDIEGEHARIKSNAGGAQNDNTNNNDDDDYDDDDNEIDSSDDDDDNSTDPHSSRANPSRSKSSNHHHHHDQNPNKPNDPSSSSGSTHVGLLDSLRDYKKHAKQEQRQNRGLMQYKIPRSTQWAFRKAERAEQKLSGIFRRHTREPGIETEV